MTTLVGLPGLSQPETPALFIKKGSDIRVCLYNAYAATASGLSGAINIWQDDEDNYRCEAMSYGNTFETKIFKKIESAERWADKWLKKIKPTSNSFT